MQKLSSSRRTSFLSFQPPAIGPEEIAAVTETLESGWLTSGPRAAELEERVAELTGAKHCVALASEEGAIRSIFPHEIDTADPYEGEVRVWES